MDRPISRTRRWSVSFASSVGLTACRRGCASIVAAAVQDPAARELLSRFIAVRTASMTIIVDRAVHRGDLPAGTDAAQVIQTVTAQLFHRLFITGEPVTQATADRAAAIATAAARTGALTIPPP